MGMKKKRTLLIILFLLISFSSLTPFLGDTAESGLHNIIIKNTSDHKSMREKYFYMYFPNNLSGEFICPSNNGHYFNDKFSACNYPVEIHYDFTCQSVKHHNLCTSIRFLLYDANLKFERCLATVTNSDGGRRIGSVTIPAGKGVKLEYYTGKWHKNAPFGIELYRAYTGTVKITYRTDVIPPPPPTGLKVEKAVNIPDKGDYTNGNPVVVSWDQVTDRGNPASGIDYYLLVCKSQSVNYAVLKKTTFLDKGNIWFPTDGVYSLQVKATDLAGNSSGYSPYRFNVDRTPPTGSITINSGQAYTNNSSVTLNLQADDGGSGVKEMRLKNEGDAYSGWEKYYSSKDWVLPDGDGLKKVFVQYRDYVGNISNEYQSGITLDTTPPSGALNIIIDASKMKVANGKKYINSAGTINLQLSAADNLSGVKMMQFSNDGKNYSLATNFRNSENWSLVTGDGTKDIYVRFIDGAGNYSDQKGVTIKDTIILDTIGPKGEVKINDGKGYTNTQEITLKLTADDGSGIGVDKMCFSNEGKNYSQWESFKKVKSWSLSKVEDGPATVYVLYQDALSNISEKALTASILLDRKKPQGSFNITSRDGSRVFNQDTPANTIQVKINNLKLTDPGSGIEGIYLWNGAQTTPPENAVYLKSSQFSAEQGIEWELSTESGVQSVNMLVCDRAGNTSHCSYILRLDTTPPPSPDQESFRHTPNQFGVSEEHTTINFFWEATDNRRMIERFVGSYIIDGVEKEFSSGQLQTTIVGEKVQGRVGLEVVDLENNHPVTIKIRSLSKAGNESAEKTYTAWTKAVLGQIALLNGGYDEETGTHYLSWCLTEAEQAAGHHLEYGELIQGVFNVKGQAESDPAGLIKLTGLTGRQTGYYRLVAVNGSNDKTTGQVFSATVPNVPPTLPELLSPCGFARSAVEFKFKEAKDHDGDPLTYDLYLAAGAAPSDDSFELIGSLTKAEINKGLTLKKTGLLHNQTYTWYVTVDDGNSGRTSSKQALFTVDTAPPELSVEQPETPYTKRRVLQVRAVDKLSGIEKLIYKKITNDGSPNQESSEGEVALAPDADGILGGLINLEEGQYHLHFTLYDQAGNQTTKNLNNLWVDYTPPQLLSVALEMEMKDGRYIGNSERIPLRFSAVDHLSLLKGIHYRFVTAPHQEEGAGGFLPISPALHAYKQSLKFTAYDGHEYYVTVWVEDKAGNLSETKLVGPILIDRTPPEIALTAEGFNFHGGQYYLNNLETLTVSAAAKDEESASGEVQYAVVLAESKEVIGNWDQWTVAQNTSLENGSRYRIAARVNNGVGITASAYSREFTYDHTPPEISKFTGPEHDLAHGEQGIFQIWAQDQQLGIVEYRLALGSSPGATDLSSRLMGNEEGWLVTGAQQTPAVFKVELPEVDDGVYYASLIVKNAAGEEQAKELSFTVNNALEKMIVTDQGPYTSLTDRMVGSWRYLGARAAVAYRYRILDQYNNPVTEWETTVEREGSCYGLHLQPGASYRFETQAIFTEGDYSASGFSRGVIADHTPPEIAEVTAPAFTTSDRLWFQWAGADPESQIAKVQVALGSDYLLTDVTKGWVETTGEQGILSCDINGAKLNLPTNTKCYLSLRLTNGAGLMTEVTTRPITIDDTPPPTPIVDDQGAYINDQQPLEANWLWSPEDPESGTVSYQWTLLEYGERIDEAGWQEGDDRKKVILTDFSQEHGKTYYFAVKATNGAGLSSVGISDGLIVDATVPFLPKVKLLNAINLKDPLAEEVNYITGREELGLWIDSYDPESGIAGYYYTWGVREEIDAQERQESASAHIGLENPAFKDGEITVFAGESINEAGDYSLTGYSTGVLLDTGTPKVGEVRGFYSGNKIYFDWEVTASRSPVVKYEISLVPQGGSAENWREITDGRSTVFDGENLEDGYYQLLVRAYNAAGSVSRRDSEIDEWGVSPIIAVDRTPPRLISFDYTSYVSTGISCKIFGEDNLSGINCYQYALGTMANPFQFTGGWEEMLPGEGDRVEFTIETEELPHNTNLYLLVRARDHAGLWSHPSLSEQILVDHTPPEKPEIACGPYTNSQHRITGIRINGSDPESGITHYLLGMMTGEGEEELSELEPTPIEAFNGELTGLNLTEGKEYRLALSLRNAAGLWSEMAFSNPLIVDTVPPQLNFTAEGSELVLNQPPLDIEYHLSEAAEVEMVLVLPNGNTKKDLRWAETGSNYFIFMESEPGIYRLTAKAKDRAGNSGEEQTRLIRVNAPPTIILPTELGTTPGQPLQVSAIVNDGDGEVVAYRWEPGDGGEPFSGAVFAYSYLTVGEYQLTLTVTDNDGATASATVSVKVKNTTAGRLFTNETWTGEHRLNGDVLVPEGVTLTVLPGARVIVDGIPGVTGYNHTLKVEGRLMINEDGPEVSFSSVLAGPNSWQGIGLYGSADLKNLRIEHAVRGIAVINSDRVAISNCSFLHNQVGVHVYGCRPQIEQTQFEKNTFCGIKEDFSGRPLVTDCRFINNGIDYYHEELTALSMEQLNGIEGNSGNRQ